MEDGLGERECDPERGSVESRRLPGAITASAGTPQSATVSTVFATALQATVTNAGGSPVSGATVTFTAPASGASGTFARFGHGNGDLTSLRRGGGSGIHGQCRGRQLHGDRCVAGLSTPAGFSLTNNTGAAASVAASAGTAQSATISTVFATPLQATVKDADGNLVSGATVTFTAPASGASGTFGGWRRQPHQPALLAWLRLRHSQLMPWQAATRLQPVWRAWRLPPASA